MQTWHAMNAGVEAWWRASMRKDWHVPNAHFFFGMNVMMGRQDSQVANADLQKQVSLSLSLQKQVDLQQQGSLFVSYSSWYPSLSLNADLQKQVSFFVSYKKACDRSECW
jgi:hypothetical protein